LWKAKGEPMHGNDGKKARDRMTEEETKKKECRK
jgi:hypothetical protein